MKEIQNKILQIKRRDAMTMMHLQLLTQACSLHILIDLSILLKHYAILKLLN